MDCAEFRRRLLIDPGAPELAVAANARVCPDAPVRLAEALAFEHDLERALQVEVPAGLADQILAAAGAEIGPAPRARRWPWLALAASLLLASVFMVSVWRGSASPTEAVIHASVQHLAHEPYALTRTERVPQALLARMFDEAGLGVDEAQLQVSYLNRCPVGRYRSVHMVMPAQAGPVTVLFLPGEREALRTDTRAAMVAVRTVPFASGTLVLLAESNHDFDRIENVWHNAANGTQVAAGGL